MCNPSPEELRKAVNVIDGCSIIPARGETMAESIMLMSDEELIELNFKDSTKMRLPNIQRTIDAYLLNDWPNE